MSTTLLSPAILALVQPQLREAITRYLGQYEVETKGVYIQDVTFPEALVLVLTQREIANQEKATSTNPNTNSHCEKKSKLAL